MQKKKKRKKISQEDDVSDSKRVNEIGVMKKRKCSLGCISTGMCAYLLFSGILYVFID